MRDRFLQKALLTAVFFIFGTASSCIVDDHVLFPDFYQNDEMIDAMEAQQILNPAIAARLYRCKLFDDDHVVTWAGFNETLGNTYEEYWFYKKGQVESCARILEAAPCDSFPLLEVSVLCNITPYRGNFIFRD